MGAYEDWGHLRQIEREPETLVATCPHHGEVTFSKREKYHDWAWWCPRHIECYQIIWVRDFWLNPDGGDPRSLESAWREIETLAGL